MSPVVQQEGHGAESELECTPIGEIAVVSTPGTYHAEEQGACKYWTSNGGDAIHLKVLFKADPLTCPKKAQKVLVLVSTTFRILWKQEVRA